MNPDTEALREVLDGFTNLIEAMCHHVHRDGALRLRCTEPDGHAGLHGDGTHRWDDTGEAHLIGLDALLDKAFGS